MRSVYGGCSHTTRIGRDAVSRTSSSLQIFDWPLRHNLHHPRVTAANWFMALTVQDPIVRVRARPQLRKTCVVYNVEHQDREGPSDGQGKAPAGAPRTVSGTGTAPARPPQPPRWPPAGAAGSGLPPAPPPPHAWEPRSVAELSSCAAVPELWGSQDLAGPVPADRRAKGAGGRPEGGTCTGLRLLPSCCALPVPKHHARHIASCCSPHMNHRSNSECTLLLAKDVKNTDRACRSMVTLGISMDTLGGKKGGGGAPARTSGQ